MQRHVADDGILRVQVNGTEHVTRLRIEDVWVGTFRPWFVDRSTEEYEIGRRESNNSGHTRTAIPELPPPFLLRTGILTLLLDATTELDGAFAWLRT